MKPVAISLVSCSKAELVECPGRKPCWSADGSRWLLTVGSKRASITFAAGQLLLLFAMIRSVVKSFKVPDVEVAAARMSNESALTRMTDSTPKKTWSDLTLVLDG